MKRDPSGILKTSENWGMRSPSLLPEFWAIKEERGLVLTNPGGWNLMVSSAFLVQWTAAKPPLWVIRCVLSENPMPESLELKLCILDSSLRKRDLCCEQGAIFPIGDDLTIQCGPTKVPLQKARLSWFLRHNRQPRVWTCRKLKMGSTKQDHETTISKFSHL